MPSAEIITIGTEILLGEIVDTNTRYIARTLRGLGIDLYRTVTIGDNAERIASALRESMPRAEIIITTGGLGPTVDDPTRQAVARALGVETEFRQELWEQISAIIARYGRRPTENQKRQAYIPKGAIPIANPVGTAPAFIAEFSRQEQKAGVIIALPGVPNEMEYLLHASVVPYLQERFKLNQIIAVRLLHCAGLGEGAIDEKIGDLETLANPTVGLAAHTGIVDIRITAKAASEGEAAQMIAEVEQAIRQRLGHAIFGADEDTLEQVVLDTLARRGWTLTAIEAGLGGLLARKLPRCTPLPHLRSGSLVEALRAARREAAAEVALGVAVYSEERAAEMALITPNGEKTHRITYGGPPRSLPRWAMNLALNWLRTTLQEDR